ncbi:MAG: Zn-dependent hydrolase, including glyoxylase [Myxococcales bacterium]|nr:Zn-dependent hydrolase, including glyoxylase [Myxococcales bacterium]
MRVHHLNCISSCPLGGKLMDDRSNALRGRLVNHCLLVETATSLVLVDTGFGLRDVEAPRTRLSRFFLALNSPELRREMTAVRQIERLGFDPRDVRNIVLTHLDFDHAGGLDDFPHAAVHMLALERDAAVAQRTLLDRMRYRPQQWGLTAANWHAYQAGEGEPWLGFDCVRDLDGVAPEILMLPLIGHTLGHAGVAIEGDHGWILLTGDAYFFHREMDLERPYCTPGLRLYQWMMEKDRGARLWNQKRLRALKMQQGSEVRIFCSHDPTEFERLAGRPAWDPAANVRPSAAPMQIVVDNDEGLRGR